MDESDAFLMATTVAAMMAILAIIALALAAIIIWPGHLAAWGFAFVAACIVWVLVAFIRDQDP